jgi:hypothetical protein
MPQVGSSSLTERIQTRMAVHANEQAIGEEEQIILRIRQLTNQVNVASGEISQAIADGRQDRAMELDDNIQLLERTIKSLRTALSALKASPSRSEEHESQHGSLNQAAKRVGAFGEAERANPEGYWHRLLTMRSAFKLSVSQTRDVLLMQVPGIKPDDQRWLNGIRGRTFATIEELEECFMKYFRSRHWRYQRMLYLLDFQQEPSESIRALGERFVLAMESLNVNPRDENTCTFTWKELFCTKLRSAYPEWVQNQIHWRESQRAFANAMEIVEFASECKNAQVAPAARAHQTHSAAPAHAAPPQRSHEPRQQRPAQDKVPRVGTKWCDTHKWCAHTTEACLGVGPIKAPYAPRNAPYPPQRSAPSHRVKGVCDKCRQPWRGPDHVCYTPPGGPSARMLH